MPSPQALSIIVPTLNEADNIDDLAKRIDAPLKRAGVEYEIIVVDDHSTDQTVSKIRGLARFYPIRVMLKNGRPGKASSLIEGFASAKYPLICMIDADLQYPPEDILPMYNLLIKQEVDIVITRRSDQGTGILRQLSSKVFNLIFTRLLFGINYDTQSGLKLFRKNILDQIHLNPSPWSFDLEFLVRSLEQKFKILSHTISFSERTKGETKVNIFGTTMELAGASLKVRRSSSLKRFNRNPEASWEIFKRPLVILPGLTVGGLIVLAAGIGAPKASALSLNAGLILPIVGSTSLNIGQQNPAAASPNLNFDPANSSKASSPEANQPTANYQPTIVYDASPKASASLDNNLVASKSSTSNVQLQSSPKNGDSSYSDQLTNPAQNTAKFYSYGDSALSARAASRLNSAAIIAALVGAMFVLYGGGFAANQKVLAKASINKTPRGV